MENRARLRKRWRKRVGVEPTKDRLTTLTGFEVQPPHQGRVSSDIGAHASAYHDPRAPKRSRLSRLTWRASPWRTVTPARSKNSRIWIATLRPEPILSRNVPAVSVAPALPEASRSAILIISTTVERRKK